MDFAGAGFSMPIDDEETRHSFGMDLISGAAATAASCTSPSPSPVFLDDDSMDSGYSGSCQGKFDDHDYFPECKRKTKSTTTTFLRHKSFCTLKVCHEEREDCMDFAMDKENSIVMREDDATMLSPKFSDDSPFASLRVATILRDSTNTKDCRRTRTIKALKRNQRLATLAQSESPFTSLKVPSSSTSSCSTPSTFVSRCRSESEIGILEAIQKADENRTLIGDFSEGHVLPLLKNPKVPDLKCISAQTVCDILENRYQSKIGRFALIDCRYPYEFNGGHIRTSVNLYTQDLLQEFLDRDTVLKQQQPTFQMNFSTSTPNLRNVVLFYCEYSKERGPKMCRFLRTVDRKKNEYRYPCLDYPEIYLIEGGYKNFYGSFKHLCEPQSYKPMDHEDHTEDLRKFRTKSKSWSSLGTTSVVVNASARKLAIGQ